MTIILLALLVILFPSVAQAITVDSGLSSTLELGTADLESTVISIIQWALGFLGLVAVIMIIGAAVIASTSGDTDRGARARSVIVGAIIGLIVIIFAWAIVTFVVNTGNQVTN